MNTFSNLNKIDGLGKRLSPTILRVGMALVFLWFGIDQIIDPISWVAYVPEWLTGSFGIGATAVVYANGAFEVLFGTALLLGFFTRFVAFFLMLHMLDITYIVGFDAIGVRDFGLTVATLVVWLNGPNSLTLDKFIRGKDPVALSDIPLKDTGLKVTLSPSGVSSASTPESDPISS